jgi:PAS domain-containing protein
MEVLQTSALPLGYGAIFGPKDILKSSRTARLRVRKVCHRPVLSVPSVGGDARSSPTRITHPMSHHSGSKKAPPNEVVALKKQVADLKESAVARRRVEDALRAAEELHRSTLEEAPSGILRLDRSGRLLYANLAFIKALGYQDRQDFKTIGELRGVFITDEEARRVVEIAAGPPSRVVARCLRRDGCPDDLLLLVGAGTGGPGDGVTVIHSLLDRPPLEV